MTSCSYVYIVCMSELLWRRMCHSRCFWRMYFCYLGFDAIRMHFLAAKIARNTGSFGEIYGSHTLSFFPTTDIFI